MGRALLAEIIKLRRAKLVWISALVLLAGPMLAATVVSALSDPVRAEALGLTAEMTQQLGEPGWTMMFQSVTEIAASGIGLILYPILAASLFVTEYSSGTMKVMMTLPVRRSQIVVSKFVALAGWLALLTAYLFTASIALLMLLANMGPPSPSEALYGALLLGETTLLLYLGLGAPCLLATTGRGYLPPMVFVGAVAVLGVALTTGGSGLTAYVVWFMPAAHGSAVSLGDPSPIGPLQWTIACGTFLATATATWARIRFFDAPR